jgi:hypothetical protein
MITPFTADGANVDWPVLDSLIEWYVEEDEGRENEIESQPTMYGASTRTIVHDM